MIASLDAMLSHIVAPPLIITEEQLAEELKKLDDVLSEVDREFL